MKKATIHWSVIAIVSMLLGVILFISAIAASGWNIKAISNKTYETNTHTIDSEFQNITIETSSAEIIFKRSDDFSTEILCFEESKAKHSVVVENDTLVITETDTRQWFDFISVFHFDSPKITVYLPQNSYAMLDIDTDSGDINIADMTFNSLSVFSHVGDISLYNVIAKETFRLESDTGDIEIANCDALEISAKTNTGEITGTLLSEKIFFAQSDTGNISIPQTKCGGKCELFTDTGDIRIELK